MEMHVRNFAVLSIVLGVAGLLTGLITFVFLGGVDGLISAFDLEAYIDSSLLQLISVATNVMLIVWMVLGLPSIFAGLGLMRYSPWARVVMLIVSALNLISIPVGTVVGLYGLWVLMSPESEPLFTQPPGD
ncbi:MAG: hypothetical protein FJW40_22000 [Acidobacteria bacterium]|nr:hypothetical protein [Acidobacteriota bacterium]